MWKNIQINDNQIDVFTDRAALVKMPNNSEYCGYKFWHPIKLIRNGKHSSASSLSYTDEFEFKLLKYGKGKHNSRDVIDEIVIDSCEFEDAFGVTSDNVREKQTQSLYHVPDEIEPQESGVLEDLADVHD